MEQKSLEALIERLHAHSRRQRQSAAQGIYEGIKDDPKEILPYLNQLEDALGYPEAQTRWEIFDILTLVAPKHPDEVESALEPAENSLFDEESAPVRLAAFSFLAVYGSTSEKRSDTVWPLLDEAVQCYHGDAEYRDMLVALLDMAKGTISAKTAQELKGRISFDVKSGSGYIRALSQDIEKELDRKAQ